MQRLRGGGVFTARRRESPEHNNRNHSGGGDSQVKRTVRSRGGEWRRLHVRLQRHPAAEARRLLDRPVLVREARFLERVGDPVDLLLQRGAPGAV